MFHRRNLLALFAAAACLALSAPLRAEETTILAQGEFRGESGHATGGAAAIVEQDGRFFVSLGRDFSFDGAPDPKVALGRDGYRPEGLLAPLRSGSGAQTYEIPLGLDPREFNEIRIWCEQFNVPLGVARLE